jgi:hypothetical protein
MRLLTVLADVVRRAESAFGVNLTDEHFEDGREEILHVFLHETCHAVVAASVPWIHDLPEQEHTALDEVLARLLETELGGAMGFHVHSVDEHVRELSMYGVEIPADLYQWLQEEWREHYSAAGNLVGMAGFALEALRRADVS